MIRLDGWVLRGGAEHLLGRVRVPYRGGTCNMLHGDGWSCTRRDGHTGRHAAALSDGSVVAVWATVSEPTC